MVAPVVAAGAARAATFARPVVMGSMKKTMQSTARGGAKVGSRSAVRGSAGTGTAMKKILNASTLQDSMSLLETVEQVSGSKPIESKKVLADIRDGITNLGSIFSKKISGLNTHLAFRLDKLNTTMTTIGKVLASDLDLEKKTFDDANKDQIEEDRKRSLEDPKEEDKSGGFFAPIKSAFDGIIDFLTPKSEFAKVGLAGLAVLAIFAFKDRIIAAFETVFEYLASLKDAFDEEGFVGLKNKLGKDIQRNVIGPILAPLSLQIDENGEVSRIAGGWLDMATLFSGPTNIPKTFKAFFTGLYDGKRIYPDWYYMTPSEVADAIVKGTPGVLEKINGTMMSIGEGISDFFLGAYVYSDEEGLGRKQSGLSKLKDQMMENFRNNMQSIADFFHDENGNLFGIDFKALKDLLPTIQEIAESIYYSLPKYLRFDTLAEKNVDRDVERLKDIDFFEKDYAFQKSEITRSKIDEVTADELRSLLSQQRDDLRPEDIRYIESKIIEKDLMRISEKKESVLKTNKLKTTISEKDKETNTIGKSNILVSDSSSKANISNYSKTNINANDFRTQALELSAQEQMNFFRNR